MAGSPDGATIVAARLLPGGWLDLVRVDPGTGETRLDARIEKRWQVGETGWVSIVIEGMNLTLQKEIVDFEEVTNLTPKNLGLSVTCHWTFSILPSVFSSIGSLR